MSFGKLKEMREKVKEEMKHIPKGDEPQMEFRMIYWSLRMNSLGKKAGPARASTKGDVLKKAAEHLTKYHPDYKPYYDKEFFNK
ncbi:MAG: hypothetical protein ACREBU_05530 [Nitrososphaera sp.]